MDFPRVVFTSPGPLTCNGGTYGQQLVNDATEYDAAIKAGYFGTLPEALKKQEPPKKLKTPEKP